MAVLKNKTKRDNFLVVSKIFLQDKNLSLTERGLLATMHSLPDDWDFTIAGMGKILPDGESRIRTALDGLVDKGYVSKKQSKDNAGKFGKNIIEVNERPLLEKPLAENPITEKTIADFPLVGNQSQYNNNECSIKEYMNNRFINLSKVGDSIEEMPKVDAYKELISENIHLDWLYEVAKRHSADEVTMVTEIYEVICDMVCYPRASVVIKETKYPWHVVKSKFLKLKYEHICAVLDRIIDADLHIRNMQSYLVSTLFTQVSVGTLEAQANIHDDYLKMFRGKPYEY